MTFEEWWNGQDYPASCKGNCQKAFESRESELAEKDTIINFLKKELIHKTAYKNVMKKQYRELKDKLYSVELLSKKRGECYLDTLKTLNDYRDFIEQQRLQESFTEFLKLKN